MKIKVRRGVAVVEVIAACGVLLALMLVVAAVTAQNYRGRHAAERHAWALSEASNCLERLSIVSWDTLTPERAKAESLSSSAREVLGPTSTMSVTIQPTVNEPTARKVQVEVHWTNDGKPAPPVRLTMWRYRLPATIEVEGGRP